MVNQDMQTASISANLGLSTAFPSASFATNNQQSNRLETKMTKPCVGSGALCSGSSRSWRQRQRESKSKKSPVSDSIRKSWGWQKRHKICNILYRDLVENDAKPWLQRMCEASLWGPTSRSGTWQTCRSRSLLPPGDRKQGWRRWKSKWMKTSFWKLFASFFSSSITCSFLVLYLS